MCLVSSRAEARHDDLHLAVHNSLKDLSGAIQELDRASSAQMSKFFDHVNKTNVGNVATVTAFIEKIEANLKKEISQVSETSDIMHKEQKVVMSCVLNELHGKLVQEINHESNKHVSALNRSLEEVDSRLVDLSSETSRLSETQHQLERKLSIYRQDNGHTLKVDEEESGFHPRSCRRLVDPWRTS